MWFFAFVRVCQLSTGTYYVRLVLRRSPDRGGILTSSKKTEKNVMFAFVRVCQLNTGTYHVRHIYAENSILPVVCSFWHGEECGVAFLCCWAPLPSFPWPIQNKFVTVGCSRVCVGLSLARLCFNCVYWASSSVFAWASIATWGLYCFVLWCGVKGRVGTAVLFLSRKDAARLSKWLCCRRWSCEAEQWKCRKREETAWSSRVTNRLHAVTWPTATAVILGKS